MTSIEKGLKPKEIMPGEKSAQLAPERIQELIKSLEKGAEWGAFIKFLDSINSVQELEQVQKYLDEKQITGLDWRTLALYRDNLEKWKDPEKELPTNFRSEFPLISAKLNTPQKIRIFLRGAKFCGGSLDKLARVAEHIIRQHEKAGKEYVSVSHAPNREFEIAEVLAYFTQLQAWTLRDLLFPDLKRSGSYGQNVGFDWREQEGEKNKK